ncbi:MAG: tripartite tricarboxylate transporter substrate binding protein [Burkholderiales bacterium]
MKLKISKPFLNCSTLLALTAPLALTAVAQDYPAKVVRIVVPFPAGGSTDVLARLVAQKLTESHGQNYIVENRPGATGTIAGAFVAKSAPDGHTLIMHSSSSYTAGFLYRKLSYDAARAFAPILRCAISGLYITSAATLPVSNIKELVALARRRPNEVTYGTVGTGSAAHLATEMFNAAAGIKTLAVAYKGSAPALVALASGEVGFSILNILDPQPFVKQGKLRALAVTSAKRSPAIPDVPTLLESGINVEANLWTGLFATAGTPAPIVNKLNAEIGRFISEPQMNTWLVNNLGGEFSPHTPEQFSEFLTGDTARWQKIIKQIGLQLD